MLLNIISYYYIIIYIVLIFLFLILNLFEIKYPSKLKFNRIYNCKLVYIFHLLYFIFGISYILTSNNFILKNNQLDNTITILMSVFTSLITFITIIFMYNDFVKKTRHEKLLKILYDIQNEIILSNEKLLDQKQCIPNLKLMQSSFNQYKKDFNKIMQQNKFSKIFLQIDIFISITTIIILILAFKFNNYIYNISSMYVLTIVTILMLINCIATYYSILDTDVEKTYPSPDILLTPHRLLNKSFCMNYGLLENIPLYLFFYGTEIHVQENIPEIRQYIHDNKIKTQADNFFIFKFLFKFNIEGILLEYKKLNATDSHKEYTFFSINYMETMNSKLPIISISIPLYTVDTKNTEISLVINYENHNIQLLTYKLNNTCLHYFYLEARKTYIFKPYYFKNWELNRDFKIDFNKIGIEKNI